MLNLPDALSLVKAPPPVLGFNNNVKHKGRVFHIQTEDSGIRHPHVITHLFADGGRILKTTKTSYAEHVGDAALTETVRGLMKEQHKAMFIALRDGQFDHLFDDAAPAQAPAAAPAPPVPSLPVTGPPKFASKSSASGPKSSKDAPISSLLKGGSIPLPVVPPPAPSRPGSSTSSALDALLKPKPPPPPPSPIPPPPPSRGRPTFDLDQASIAPAQRDVSPTAPIVRRATPLGTPATEAGLDLDLDALERAAAEAETPFFQQIQDLPPPPAAVVGKKPPMPVPLHPPRPSPPGEPRSAREPKSVPRPTPALAAAALHPGTPSAGRYAMSRPAAIFSTSRPAEGSSIFGEDLISEKSLDEVILSYLAEDLETPSEK